MRLEAPKSLVDRVVLGVAALWAISCIALLGYRAAFNPLNDRRAALDARLAAITYVPERFETAEQVNYRKLREAVTAKEALWKDLIDPPPKPGPVETKPDLNARLEGVFISAREELVIGDTVKVMVRTPLNKSGSWLSVGDKVNGLVIAEILPEKVVFTTVINEKEHSVSLKRN